MVQQIFGSSLRPMWTIWRDTCYIIMLFTKKQYKTTKSLLLLLVRVTLIQNTVKNLKNPIQKLQYFIFFFFRNSLKSIRVAGQQLMILKTD